MTKNADFGPNLAVFGPKSLIFMGLSKSFGTNITENHFGNLSALFFGQALDQMGKNADIWPKMPVLGKIWLFWAENLIFLGGGSQTNETPIMVGLGFDKNRCRIFFSAVSAEGEGQQISCLLP